MTYQDADGNRYWIEGGLVPGVHRGDLVPVEEIAGEG